MELLATLRNLDKILGAFSKAEATAKAAQILGVTRVAQRLRDVAVEFAGAGHPDNPEVQTGELRSHITYQVEPGGETTRAVVGTPTPYAPFVEFGHKQQPGRFVPALGKRLVASDVKAYPFMRPAINKVFDGGEAMRLYTGAIREKFGF